MKRFENKIRNIYSLLKSGLCILSYFGIVILLNSSLIYSQSGLNSYPYILHPLSKKVVGSETEFFFDDYNGDGYYELIDLHKNMPEYQKIHLHKQKYPLVSRQLNYFNEELYAISPHHDRLTGRREILVFYKEADALYMERRSVNGDSIGTMKIIDLPIENRTGEWDGKIVVLGFADLNRDGTDEVICKVTSGFSLNPRGIIAIDISGGKNLWEFMIGAVPSNSEVAVFNVGGKKYLLFSTLAPANGYELNGFDDSHTYLIMLNEDGKLVWSNKMGGAFSSVAFKQIDFDGDGVDEIISITSIHNANESQEYMEIILENELIVWEFKPDIPELIKENSYESDNLLSIDFDVTDFENDGRNEIVISETGIGLTILDNELNVRDRYRTIDYIAQKEISDLDEDGNYEILAVVQDRGLFVFSAELELLANLEEIRSIFYVPVAKTAISDNKKSGWELIGIDDNYMYKLHYQSNPDNYGFRVKEIVYGAAGGSLLTVLLVILYLSIRRGQPSLTNMELLGILTPREIEVAESLAEGLSSKEIGAKLFISTKTVEKHKENMMKKLGVHNTAGIIRFFYRNGGTNS